MFEQAELHGHKFMVAFDYQAKDGCSVKKIYASYPSSEDFVSDTLLKTEHKHFYELIPEGKPCKLFLDIEWTGRDDPKRRVIHHVVDKLKKYTKVREKASTAAQEKKKTRAQLDLELLFATFVFWKFIVR